MKKSLKVLAASIAVIPCALALTACGGTGHTLVDTNGSYSQASSYSEVEAYVEDNAITTDLESYKMLMDMDASISLAQFGDFDLTSKTESIIQYDDETLNMYLKQTGSSAGEEMSFETYVKNNYMYNSNGLGGWTDGYPMESYEIEEYVLGELSLENVFASLSATDLAGLTVKADINENATKFKITLDGQLLNSYILQSGAMSGDEMQSFIGSNINYDDATMYYVFENNKFAGATMDISFSADIKDEETSATIMSMTCDLTIEFARYTGSIDFPADLDA